MNSFYLHQLQWGTANFLISGQLRCILERWGVGSFFCTFCSLYSCNLELEEFLLSTFAEVQSQALFKT
jgi:hypothetical protein